jgi:hypothetical protein
VATGNAEAAELCAAVARDMPDGAVAAEARTRLLGFAMQHCPHELVGDLLRHWRRVEAGTGVQVRPRSLCLAPTRGSDGRLSPRSPTLAPSLSLIHHGLAAGAGAGRGRPFG